MRIPKFSNGELESPREIKISFEHCRNEPQEYVEPCGYIDLTGDQTWFMNVKKLSEAIGFCEHHTNELLDDKQAVSLIRLDNRSAFMMAKIMKEMDTGEIVMEGEVDGNIIEFNFNPTNELCEEEQAEFEKDLHDFMD